MGAMSAFQFRAALLAIVAFDSPELFACGHQSPNPHFLSAQARMPTLLSSRVADRAALEKEWSELQAEQRRLWDMAGRIDEPCLRGAISPELPGYLRDLGIWEQRLRRLLETIDWAPGKEPHDPGPGSIPPSRSGQGVDEVQFGRSRGSSRKLAPSPVPPPIPSPTVSPDGEPPPGLL